MTEKQLQDAIVDMARLLGWRCAHFRPARTDRGWRTSVSYDGAGFPDLVLVRERVLFAELKAARGKLSLEQGHWAEALLQAGAAYYVWTPGEWANGRVEAVLR